MAKPKLVTIDNHQNAKSAHLNAPTQKANKIRPFVRCVVATQKKNMVLARPKSRAQAYLSTAKRD
jgi:hypothetical protein